MGATEYWNDSQAIAIAKSAAGKGKLLGAICIAPVTLANAGLLEGKKATVWESEVDKLKAKGAKYTGAAVEVDGNVITANGPEAAAGFGSAIVVALGG
jgi:protease I